MSRTGAENTWLPFDLGQEENICDIKVSAFQMTRGEHVLITPVSG
jgi:hypothetical protein